MVMGNFLDRAGPGVIGLLLYIKATTGDFVFVHLLEFQEYIFIMPNRLKAEFT